MTSGVRNEGVTATHEARIVRRRRSIIDRAIEAGYHYSPRMLLKLFGEQGT
jgi:hypothetical protein